VAPVYRFDHVHIVSLDPKGMAQYFHRMFDAKILESVTPEGKPRVDLNLNGLTLFIFPATPEENLPQSPPGRYLGLDHIGLIVDDLDEAVAELRRRGAEFAAEPRTLRPGHKISFIRGPENVRIEVMERRPVEPVR